MQTLPEFKRVVTGHDEHGQAIVASNGPTPNVFPLASVPGTVFHELWNSSTSPALLDNASDPSSKPLQLSPGPLGSVIRVVDIPPDSVQDQVSAESAAAVFAEIGQSHAGTGKADSRHKLMHRTETLDYGIVTEGEVWLYWTRKKCTSSAATSWCNAAPTMPGATAPKRWRAWSSSCSTDASRLS